MGYCRDPIWYIMIGRTVTPCPEQGKSCIWGRLHEYQRARPSLYSTISHKPPVNMLPLQLLETLAGERSLWIKHHTPSSIYLYQLSLLQFILQIHHTITAVIWNPLPAPWLNFFILFAFFSALSSQWANCLISSSGSIQVQVIPFTLPNRNYQSLSYCNYAQCPGCLKRPGCWLPKGSIYSTLSHQMLPHPDSCPQNSHCTITCVSAL